MKKIVVTGANGFIGRRILQHLSAKGRCEAYGFSLNADKWPGKGYKFIRADITDMRAMKENLYGIRPDVVINTAALSVVDYCEAHQREAYTVNTSAVKQLAQTCTELNSRLIHLSTDFVFDGNTGKPYTEGDSPDPVNYYGQTKWLGEKEVASHCSNWAIARVVLVYGKTLPGQHGNIVQLVRSKLEKKEPVKVVTDQYRTPVWVEDVVQGVDLLSGNGNLNGIYHICGRECLSIADIAYRTAGFFNLDPSLIIPVTTEEMNEQTPRPRFSCLSIAKAQKDLNYTPHILEEGMSEW